MAVGWRSGRRAGIEKKMPISGGTPSSSFRQSRHRFGMSWGAGQECALFPSSRRRTAHLAGIARHNTGRYTAAGEFTPPHAAPHGFRRGSISLHRPKAPEQLGRRCDGCADAGDRVLERRWCATRLMPATPSGHLVFLRLGTLFAVPLAPAPLRSRPNRLSANVSALRWGGATYMITGAGQFSITARRGAGLRPRTCSAISPIR